MLTDEEHSSLIDPSRKFDWDRQCSYLKSQIEIMKIRRKSGELDIDWDEIKNAEIRGVPF